MKLLYQVRQVMRVQHLSYRTEQPYVQWIERFIRHWLRQQAKLQGPQRDGPRDRNSNAGLEGILDSRRGPALSLDSPLDNWCLSRGMMFETWNCPDSSLV